MLYNHHSMLDGEPRLRVLYVAAKGETQELFQMIEKDLLAAADMRIFFEEEEDPDMFDELGQMHLVVFPVTKKLLANENDRSFMLIRKAMEEGIPILPLLQTQDLRAAIEKAETEYDDVCKRGVPDAMEEAYERRVYKAKDELEELIDAYNAAFQGRQYLDKGSRDKTELPFPVKLRSFLNSFLVDEKTEKLVKSAFDAHIFMSYRKKDRKNMQELMRLIHRQKDMEKVAIWYDEFLTPGRKFDEVLKEKLRQCDLMTLAVTPNLLSPGNYVHEHEYPFALENGVKIFPVEIARTDREEYRGMYPKLAEPLSVEKEEEVIGRLTEILSAVAWSDRLDDDAHRYYLGLAYLYGIDTNVDRDKGCIMIRSAAKNGFADAMEKYASMLFYGEAGDPSPEDAIRRQTEALQKREEAFASEQSAANALASGIAYRTLGDYTHAMKRDATDFNLKAWERLKQALALSSDDAGTDEALETLETMSDRLGSHYQYEKKGEMNEGDFPYCQHLEYKIDNVKILAEHHYKDYGVLSVLELYRDFYTMADQAWKHDFDVSVPDFRRGELAWLEKIYEETDDPICVPRLKEIYFSIEESTSYLKGLQLLERFPEGKEALLQKRSKVLSLLMKEEKWAEMLALAESYNVLKGESSETGMELKDELRICGICHVKLHHYREAKELLERALSLEEERLDEQLGTTERYPETDERNFAQLFDMLSEVYSAPEVQECAGTREDMVSAAEKVYCRITDAMEKIMDTKIHLLRSAPTRKDWVEAGLTGLSVVNHVIGVFEKRKDEEKVKKYREMEAGLDSVSKWRPKYSYEWDDWTFRK